MRQHIEAAGGVERDLMQIMSDFDMDNDFRISYKEFIENALNQNECDEDVESRQKHTVSTEGESVGCMPGSDVTKLRTQVLLPVTQH